MFDQVAVGTLKLSNTGKVAFEFEGISGLGTEDEGQNIGLPVLKPHKGKVEANSEVLIEVHYLPGVPEKFHKTFEVKRSSVLELSLSLFMK